MSVPIVPEMILNRPNRSYTILSSDDSDEDDNGDDDNFTNTKYPTITKSKTEPARTIHDKRIVVVPVDNSSLYYYSREYYFTIVLPSKSTTRLYSSNIIHYITID